MEAYIKINPLEKIYECMLVLCGSEYDPLNMVIKLGLS